MTHIILKMHALSIWRQNLSSLQLRSIKRMSYIQILNSRSCFQRGLALSLYSRCCSLLIQVTRTRQRMRVLSWWLPATVMHMIIKTEPGSEQLQANLEVTTFFQICNPVNAPNSVCLFLHVCLFFFLFFLFLWGFRPRGVPIIIPWTRVLYCGILRINMTCLGVKISFMASVSHPLSICH